MTDPKYTQTFTLPDGRVLGYSEVGPSTGYPLLYCHGFPLSRLESVGFKHIAHRHNLRILTLDRPGFGVSDYYAGRRMIDWPADVKALAQHVDLERFAILGGSGGGPYALACAYALPKEMMSAVGLFASGGAYGKDWEHVPAASKILAQLANSWPTGTTAIAAGAVSFAKWALDTAPIAARLEAWLAAEHQKGLEKKSEEHRPDYGEAPCPAELREEALQVAFDGFAQGSKVFTQEAQIMSGDWGFALEQIEYDPIKIWHGTSDVNAPIEWIRALADRIPHKRVVEFEGDTHFSLVQHMDSVLKDLVPESSQNKS